jgi:hypothetical protein
MPSPCKHEQHGSAVAVTIARRLIPPPQNKDEDEDEDDTPSLSRLVLTRDAMRMRM